MFRSLSASERRELVINGSIYRTIAFLAIPTIFFGIINALIPLIDNFFINNTGTVAQASAISYSASIINVILAFSTGLSTAAMAIIGKAFGSGKAQDVRYVASQAVLIAITLGIIMIPIVLLTAYFSSLKLIDGEMRVAVFSYIALFSIATFFNFYIAIYTAIKNSTSMPEMVFKRMCLMLVLKLVFNFIFLFIFRLNVVGAALTSIMSTLIVSIWTSYDLFYAPKGDLLSFKLIKWDRKLYSDFAKVSIPTIIANLVTNFGFVLINFELLEFGKEALNASGIASSINNLAFILPIAVSGVVTTCVSINIGNNNILRAREITLKATILCLVFTTISVLVVTFNADFLVLAFTKNLSVIPITKYALFFFNLSMFPLSILFAYQAVLIALGKTKLTLLVSVLRIWLFRYLFIMLTKSFLGYKSVFIGNLFSNILSCVAIIIIVKNIKWKSDF